MKYFVFLTILLLFVACKDIKKEIESPIQEVSEAIIQKTYPENISKIFNAHGGLDHWNSLQGLSFTMDKPTGQEVTITDLKNRKSFISTDKYKIGFNGKDVWIKQDSLYYKGNPRFYYNLMFYFYAMPFILSDDGINYQDANPLIFEGKTYLGIKISYNSGVGESPKDEYFLYYDAETFQMTWLGYTVTFFTKEKGKELHFIKYSNWQDVDGLLLPETLTWYAYENNQPTEKKSDLKFIDITLSIEKPNPEVFEVLDGATLVE